MLRKVIIPVLLLSTAACISMFESSFASAFSLKELVQRNQTNSGLNCSTGGGGGGGSGIGTGAGGIGGTHSNFHKGESFSCQISDAEKFDRAKFIQTLKASVEKDLETNDAEITSSKNTDTSFTIEYVLGKTSGRVEISGTRSGGNYYSFDAKLSEKSGT